MSFTLEDQRKDHCKERCQEGHLQTESEDNSRRNCLLQSRFEDSNCCYQSKIVYNLMKAAPDGRGLFVIHE